MSNSSPASNGLCTCNAGYYLTDNGCVPCFSSCRTCIGGQINQCDSCYDKATLRNGQCVCPDGSYPDKASQTCIACLNNCATCLSDTFCVTCKDGYRLTAENKCEVAFFTRPFGYSLEVLHDQVLVTTNLEGSEDEKYEYIKRVGTDSLLNIAKKDGSGCGDFMKWKIIEDSKYEWQRGLVRFALEYTDDKEAYPAVLQLTPSSLPTVQAKRLLQETSTNPDPKDYDMPTNYYISEGAKSGWYIGFVILYILVILTMFFLICIRPFFKELRHSVRCFWFAQNVMWFQVIFLYGYLAVEFKGALDEILKEISKASLRYFGADIEFTFVSNLNQLRNGYYVGKYTGSNETPYVFQRMLIPMICYFITYISSFVLSGTIKEIVIAIRSGIGFSYGVQFVFLCCVNFVAFFGAGAYNGYTIFGLILAVILLILVWVEVIMSKLQVQSHKPNFMFVEKNKGMATYDIIGESYDKRVRDYKNLWLNEVDCLLLIAMFLGFLGRAMIATCIIQPILAVLALVSILIIKQQFKIWKIILALTNILILVAMIILQAVGRQPSLSTVQGLTVFFMISVFLNLLFNIIIWILRLLDLLKPDYSKATETVYMEKTPRKPKNEMVTYQKEEAVTKISKENQDARVVGYEEAENVNVVRYDRQIDDRSAHSAYSRGGGNRPAYLARGGLMDESRSGINDSRLN